MKITPTGFEFNDFKSFKRFAVDQGLIGSISLTDPILDKSGNVLIKEKVNIKDSMMKKLEDLDGQYIADFKLSFSGELMKKIKEQVARAVYRRFEDKSNDFLNYIYKESNTHLPNFRGIILNAFCTRNLTLVFFRILLEKPIFFNHCADLGLLSLGSVIQKKTGVKMVNRYSFLAGILADISLIDTDYWKNPLNGDCTAVLSKFSTKVCEQLNLPFEVSDAINGHPILDLTMENGINAEGIESDSIRNGKYFNEILTTNATGDSVTSENEEGDEGAGEKSAEFATEALRIGRYIMENLKSTTDKNQVSEKLLVMFTYNTEKGYFRKDIADPMISQFKMFDTVIQRIRIISDVENKCRFPKSAWAYPKPKSAQILCKNSKFECPLIVSGWDINVIATQDPFGYIGTHLPAGGYPKCALEEELQERLGRE
ncbi:hypothetical protein [Leptospira sp. GIMC2001]|uniref:hypothetical protein n=1 Tax=Leptospira sp. GIMC2001 TaxID=1513297 RepID=UPI002349FDDD|nr:hypothetical protein [Leptospira sp. GIMC2001]WCL48068.1 hypothetical protein O4O04_12155 [Leptospira sp. GIMC2001]